MKPAQLLMTDLLRAHSTFLMHHDSSLSALFVRSKRSKFVAALTRYWDLFLSTWNVMLQGNPAREIFGGINIAASGELGVGVGEEERGSGEREVLEGLIGRIEGLVDVVVSKFGPADETDDDHDDEKQWLGTGQQPVPDDGAIFLGTGALSRKSIRDATHWMEDLYTWGEQAYGVVESPTSYRRKPRRAKPSEESVQKPSEESPKQASGGEQQPQDVKPAEPPVAEDGAMDKMYSYLKLGYGTHWNFPGTFTAAETSNETPKPQAEAPEPVDQEGHVTRKPRPGALTRTMSSEAAGHYLIGLKGEIEEASSDHYFSGDSGELDAERNSRTVLRTVNVELESEAANKSEATIVKDFEHGGIMTQSQVVGNSVPGYSSHDLNKAKKLRVVVYVNKPFIFTFFFQLRTDSLAWDSLYRSLHYQLAPLKKPLVASTNYRPERPNGGRAVSHIYDLVFDSTSLTVQSNIPNIPETYHPEDSWSRADAINTHLHLLNIYSSTRTHSTRLEQTSKTNRGWWIVWTHVAPDHASGSSRPGLSPIQESTDDNEPKRTKSDSTDDSGKDFGHTGNHVPAREGKEIFLVRRASDHGGFRSMGNYGEASGFESAGRLVQGIGVDTRRYVEELLNLL